MANLAEHNQVNPVQVNLVDLAMADLASFFEGLGEKPFRAQQLVRWVHQRGIVDFDAMTDFSLKLRKQLHERANIAFPELAMERKSSDGTLKWLIRLAHGDMIETVYIPETKRGTLCVSSQIGCALDCSFCATGKQGFNRNLTVAEIIGQVWIAARVLEKQNLPLTNVVMMGMGEPLLNFKPVVAAMDLMLSDYAYGLSKYRVTLSTSGLVPQMRQLKALSPVALAVSLHASTDDLRDELVPINKHYPLKELMAVCADYFANEPRRKVMFEYVMLDGINDQPEHARALIKLLKNKKAKINLIPFNPFKGTEYKTSPKNVIESFQKILMDAKIHTTIRKTRGEDEDGACGQLVGRVTDKIRRVNPSDK